MERENGKRRTGGAYLNIYRKLRKCGDIKCPNSICLPNPVRQTNPVVYRLLSAFSLFLEGTEVSLALMQTAVDRNLYIKQ